ncbi:MAG: DUF169 domain-containing protein [Dehalococcoidales bacterium]|nr:DUF169 domain-containing protein [Dehalococcoidales bacterium]
MASIEDYNKYGEDLEKILMLRTSPIAVKMLEKEEDIPEGAIRPKRDRGYHLAQCQVYALNRRKGESIAMLKEDQWCWAPLMGYGLVEDPQDDFVNSHAYFPRFAVGKYIGTVSAPLKTANFIPDMVLIYSNTAQLRNLVSAVKMHDKELVHSDFDPIDSCVYSVVPVIEKGEYRITIPDPGEYERAMAGEDEMIFSVPAKKLDGLVETLKQADKMGGSYKGQTYVMTPDFPRPPFYTELFKKWGLDTEEE